MYDARDDILELFKQSTYDEELDTFYYLTASDGTNSVNIRVCKSEEADDKTLPLIVLSLSDATSIPADVKGELREDVCLIDCNIYLPRTGEYDWKSLMDDIVNEITSTIWNAQASITNTYIECIAYRDLGKLEKHPILRRLIEIRAIKLTSKPS